jgi:hypothetical protein
MPQAVHFNNVPPDAARIAGEYGMQQIVNGSGAITLGSGFQVGV